MAQSEDGPLKIIMGRKSEEEIKSYITGQNMSEVGSHLEDIGPRRLEPSYYPGFSSKLYHNGESDIG